jgi:hypothetical protein
MGGMKPRKYLRLPLSLFLSASLLDSAACAQEPKPSAFAVERLDKVNAFIECGDEASALQILETMWQSPQRDD